MTILKLYAVRDRLIDYFRQPFVGPGDKEVMTALATQINRPEGHNDINQTPHHFELWELAEIDEEGNTRATKQLVCDCASLVRPGIRERGEYGYPEGPGASPGRTGALSSGLQHANAHDGAPAHKAPPEAQ